MARVVGMALAVCVTAAGAAFAGEVGSVQVSSLAFSKNDGRLYAATPDGLLVSPDGGSSWATIFRRGRPVTAVGTGKDAVYLYAPGEGLLASADPPTAFRQIGDPPTSAPVVQITVDPVDSKRIAVADAQGRVLVSADGGANWKPYSR